MKLKRLFLAITLLAVAASTGATVLWNASTGDINFRWLAPAGITGLPTISLDSGTKTATASSGAATLNKMAGVITSEALTTAAAATYTLTLTNSDVAAADQVFASVNQGTSSAGTPNVATVSPVAGAVTFTIQNIHATAALNGTIQVRYIVIKN